MWRPWGRSRAHNHKTSSSAFSCSSFKDIQTLCLDQPSIPSIFHRLRLHQRSLPEADQRVVLYFTSLRVVRSTFEDCRAVRSILRGFRVRMDERDLSMDSRFVRELQGMISTMTVTLPRVFIGGRYIGGAEEVRRLHETGELKKLLQGLPAADSTLCHLCAGHRFLLCDHCDGSRKLYTHKAGFKTCTACNENGLLRCPSCS